MFGKTGLAIAGLRCVVHSKHGVSATRRSTPASNSDTTLRRLGLPVDAITSGPREPYSGRAGGSRWGRSIRTWR